MYKRMLVPYKLLWSISVRCRSVPHLVGVVEVGTPVVGTPVVATSWALPQRVLLVLALPLLRLLDLHLPKLSQSTALCWSSSSSLPYWSRPLTAKRAGEDQEGGPCSVVLDLPKSGDLGPK
jgi:hypothetical protein